MADTADGSKKKKPGEAEEAVAQKVKTEKKSDMKGEYEGDDAERKRKAQGQLSKMRPLLPERTRREMTTQEVIRPQTVVLLATPTSTDKNPYELERALLLSI